MSKDDKHLNDHAADTHEGGEHNDETEFLVELMAQLSSYDNETREDLLDVFFHDMEYPAVDHAEQDSAQAGGADDGQEYDGSISSGDNEADDCDPSKNPRE